MLDKTLVLQRAHISILAEYRFPTGDTVEVRQDRPWQISKRGIQSGIDVDPLRGNYQSGTEVHLRRTSVDAIPPPGAPLRQRFSEQMDQVLNQRVRLATIHT